MSRKHFQRGQASAEMLFVLLIFIAFAFGVFEIVKGISLRSALDEATAEASRALSLDPSQWDYASQLVQDSVDFNSIGDHPTVTVRVYDELGMLISSSDLDGMSFREIFILEAEAPWSYTLPLASSGTQTIRIRHWGIVERYP